MDEDGDGIEIEELKAFVEQNEMLRDDADVAACVAAAEKDGGNVMAHFESVKEKLRAAAERQEAEDGGIGDDMVRIGLYTILQRTLLCGVRHAIGGSGRGPNIAQ